MLQVAHQVVRHQQRHHGYDDSRNDEQDLHLSDSVSPLHSFLYNEKAPRILYPQGFTLKKDGGLLLSRIALQYHRRRRA